MSLLRSQISKVGMLCMPLLISCSVYPPNGNSTNIVIDNTHEIRPYSYLRVVRSNEVNKFGNPIFILSMYENGEHKGDLRTVIGRSYSQNLDRRIPGNKSPLPNGQYSIDSRWYYSDIPEAGEQFWPIEPKNFNTIRSAFGFHLDPSFEKNPKDDGTDGCIGLITVQDRATLFNFIQTSKPRYLEVSIE
jgi:hypothetical protein